MLWKDINFLHNPSILILMKDWNWQVYTLGPSLREESSGLLNFYDFREELNFSLITVKSIMEYLYTDIDRYHVSSLGVGELGEGGRERGMEGKDTFYVYIPRTKWLLSTRYVTMTKDNHYNYPKSDTLHDIKQQ